MRVVNSPLLIPLFSLNTKNGGKSQVHTNLNIQTPSLNLPGGYP